MMESFMVSYDFVNVRENTRMSYKQLHTNNCEVSELQNTNTNLTLRFHTMIFHNIVQAKNSFHLT